MVRAMANTKQKPTPPRERADGALVPLRLWVRSQHGGIKQLTEKLRELSGENVTRQAVSRWMSEDAEKRQQPSYGWGLLLEDAYKALVG